MKKRDLLNLNNSLVMLEGIKATVKFSCFVAKNKINLRDEFAVLDATRKPSAAYIAYDTKRAELAHKMADRDEKGQAKIENNNFVIIERFDEFREELTILKEANTQVIEDQKKKAKEFEAFLDEEFEFEGSQIDLKDIPETVEPSVLESFIAANLIIDE